MSWIWGRNLRVEHHLDNALPVSKVDKYKSAVVSPAVYPARQGNLAAYIISANGAAAGGLEQSASSKAAFVIKGIIV